MFVELENARYTVKTNACCKKTDVKKSSWSRVIIITHAYVVDCSKKRQEVAMVQRTLQITGKGDIQALE